MRRPPRPRRSLIALAILLAACRAGAGAGELEIRSATANLSLPSETGAIYLTINNHTDQEERLIRASVSGCGVIELHAMSMDGDLMRMRPVEGGAIVIPAGGTLELKPGGVHLMCIGKTGEFAVGATVPVTLEFARAGTLEVVAEIVPPG